ncbi:MAG: DsrE family protein [Rhodospirillales bacterium]|nr:DsrE family protein [Rhodospirillales bacterium]
MAKPHPTFDEPRKVLLSVNSKDPAILNNILYNTVNIQKYYTQDLVRIAVVGYGPGIRMLLKDSPVAARVRSLMQYDIEFVACGNTLDAIGKKDSDLIAGVKRVQAGLPEVIERRLMGWIDLNP